MNNKITYLHIVCLFAAAFFSMDVSAQTASENKNEQSNASATSQETTLSEYIEQNTDAESTKDKNGNWINNLVDTVTQKGAEVLSSDNNKPMATVHRSNASVFDISGIMLRMDAMQVMQAMQKRGYRKTSDHWEIPNFIRWRYEEQCRNQGVIGYERIGSCVYQLAKKNNYLYPEKMSFSNFQTKENIEVFFTSNFTGNKVYRVMYQTDAANVTGSGPKAEYLRNIKVFDFWKKINQKYGTPDNKEQIIWGLGENKPSLKAETGKLILEDPLLLELDYTRMSREDQKFMNTAVYTF